MESDPSFTAALLTKPEPAVGQDTPCGAVFDRLLAQPDLAAIAVVDSQQRPVGLAARTTVSTTLARPLMLDLYRRRPIRLLMDPAPLMVDAATPLGDISRRIASDKPAALTDGFIITDEGRYYGVASALDLMATSVAMADLRAWQREEAQQQAEAAQRQAEQANRAKTAFLANASHEIRTPLNAIMGFAELLQQEIAGPLGAPVYREYANDIVTGGQHLMELINDLLDLSKAEENRMELAEALVELPRVVIMTLRLLEERAAGHQVQLRNEVPRDLPPILADGRKVRQMILNLLSNAVKFTLPGGTVTVSAQSHPDGLALVVADSGVGMTEAEMARALEPWGQIDHALNRKLIGTGLGLPLTKRLIELHGGRLEMTSQPGAGTSISLIFPARRLTPLDG